MYFKFIRAFVSQSRAVVARRAHNPKVGGSNPPSATNIFKFISQHRDFKILLLTSLWNKKISYNLNWGILSTNLFQANGLKLIIIEKDI